MTITLEHVWINLANDATQSVQLELTGESVALVKRIELQTYTQGRRRAVTRTGKKASLACAFEGATRAELEQMEDWIGETVCFRDPRGRRFFCVYASVDSSEIPGADTDIVDFSITFNEITFDETV